MDTSLPGKVLLVTGSRSIKDKTVVWDELNHYQARCGFTIVKLIHGGAEGVDRLAAQWANSKDIPSLLMTPDFRRWPVAKHRFKAYYMRDCAMVDLADVVVAIWNGKSSGTRLTKDYAKKQGKLARVIEIAPTLPQSLDKL
jgi:predicted Rossmann fold nucleotide-binding protein DprA/Smf involved in DNA uptake